MLERNRTYIYGIIISACALLPFSHSISAQGQKTLEDTLGKVQEYVQIAQQSEEPSGTVSIISNSSYTDSSGALHIDGEVYNDVALITAKEVQVIATFYDTNGKVVGSARALTDPEDLPSGENATFNILLTTASIPIADIDHYSLVVDWKK
ncbi:MAG: FxLYD domain-containing protein [Nitrososphaeraceae archaeon]